MSYTKEQKIEAKKFYLKSYKVPEIEAELGINRRTLYNWIEAEAWGSSLSVETTLYSVYKRLDLLIDMPVKNDQQLKEVDTLMTTAERLESLKIKKRKAKESKGDSSSVSSGKKKKTRKGINNDLTGIDPVAVMNHFQNGLWKYQLECWELKHHKVRQYLKSRQIGMTFYFAREAFADAILNGKNQIFISASRAQADQFRQYIKSFARQWFDDMELVGKDTIELHTPNGVATLYFLSTNSTTAQSYHGNVYIDEYFWIPNFKKLDLVASAMASQNPWRITYFSTPSAKSHEAYPMWSGDSFNERMKQDKKALITFPTKEELQKGCVWKEGDQSYRRVITVDTAMKEGCDKFTLKHLQLKYSRQQFNQLFRCKFIDDSASFFRLSELQRCLADSSEWKDFNPLSDTPYKLPVWIGYDPSRSVDGSCIVVVAPPRRTRGKFRVLEKITMLNQTWEVQAETIKELTKKYTVDFIGIDTTGPGNGVFEMVQKFYPRATAIQYGLESKARLVLKAQAVISGNRIEWDSSDSDIASGFLLIKQVPTGGGGITYKASRSEKTGHADAAWAVMHAISNEGLTSNGGDDEYETTVEFEDVA